MSASSTRRRLSLLSGGSLLSALFISGAGGAALAPTAALAANECVPTAPTLATPGDNGATADTYVCSGSYSSVTYTTDGVFTLRLQNNATTTAGGVRIIGATGNNITVNRLADSPAASGDPSLTSTSGAGLWVTNTAGTINVNLLDTDAAADTPMSISGASAGVLIHNAGGAGTTTFNSNNGTISASAGSGLDVTSAGTGNVTVSSGSAVNASAWGIRAGAATGNVTVNNGTGANTGEVTGGAGAILVTGGASVTINNGVVNSGGFTGVLNGVVTLNNTGTVAFTNRGTWTSTETSSLGTGDTTLTNDALKRIVTSGASTFDFETGVDTFTNAGGLVAGAGGDDAATLTLLGLETWNNSGTLIFGEGGESWSSDGVANDRIVASGTLFTGSGGSLLVMDVDLAADQASCAAAVTADCLDLRGSTTAGVTGIAVNAVGGGLAAAERIVLVDVAGAGGSGDGHFILSDQSAGYRQIGATGAVEGGLFFYNLNYDAAAKQHVLQPSAFSGKALELARIGRAASEPWRTATGMWHDRQVDLRDSIGGEGGPAVWIKAAGNVVTQTGQGVLDLGAARFGYNMGSRQETVAVVGGVDLMRMQAGDSAWVFGLTAGKLSSSLEYRVGGSDLDLDGHSLGVYATWVGGRAFLDAIVNSTSLDVTHHDFGQAFAGSSKSFGYQLESGYRLFELNDGGFHVEPIAALSYVRTEVDDFDVGPVSASFDSASSMRAALGLRMAGDLETEALTARLAFTGRFWKEMDGEHTTTLGAVFGEASFLDTDIDTVGDVGLAVGLFRPGGRLSANLAYGLKFGEDYRSSDASISVRLRW